jgi:membrane protein implicated in regulation of membrane protease activity
MESNITGTGEIDAEIDVDVEVDVDIDSDVDVDIDSDIDIDIDSDIDIDVDAEVDIDIDSDIDVDTDLDVDSELEIELEGEVDTAISTITPAPIMLLFSTAFLVYGITGLSLFYFIQVDLRFIIFFAAPAISYLSVKIINGFWKLLAKSRYYRISSTRNLIGKEGEVTLKVDERGGVIKIPSNTPMRFERLHVKPVRENSTFERGERVFICDVKNGFLLVDNSKRLIRNKIY